MLKHIFTWFFKSTFTFLIGLPITILSPFVTLIALPFRIEHPETDKPFTDPRFISNGFHRLVTLPKWAKWWDNIYDGMWGDKRGWWDNETGDCTSFLSMLRWNGLRNPCNYFGRHIKGIDVSECKVELLAGQEEVKDSKGKEGWQFLVATSLNNKKYHRIYCVFPWWFKPTHAIMIDIGWKIKLSHNEVTKNNPPEDRFKSSVFTISIWKEL